MISERLHAFGLGEADNVFIRRRVEIDGALRVAWTDGDLFHIAIGRVQQRAGVGHRDGGNGARHVLGAQRGTLERIDRDIDLRAGLVADLLADEQHRRLVDLAFADHHRAVDRQLVELAPHGIHRGLVGGLFLALSAQPRRRNRRTLGHAHDLEGENALQQQLGLDGDRCHGGIPLNKTTFYIRNILSENQFPLFGIVRVQFFSIRMTCGMPEITLSRPTAARALRTPSSDVA